MDMRRRTFKIRRRVIGSFLCCILGVLIFAVFSYRIHVDIGRHLKVLEEADDLYQEILELRRIEKNFFLYRDPASLGQAKFHLNRLEGIFLATEEEFIRSMKETGARDLRSLLASYGDLLSRINPSYGPRGSPPNVEGSSRQEEELRALGQRLLETSKAWSVAERFVIDELSERAIQLFLVSVLVFTALGIGLAFYVAKLLVRPLEQMQQSMEQIAQGNFTPFPEPRTRAQEPISLFRAFNRMIHELERRQDELVQSRKMAAIGTLTSGIAHELNNPLNNIVLTAEAMKEELGKLNEAELAGMADDILSQSERASEIVRDLLDFARSERPSFEEIHVGELIRQSLKLVSNQAAVGGIEVEAGIAEDLPDIYGERRNLQQVFVNLFVNAIQAMPDGGTLTVRAYRVPGTQDVAVMVADTGVGIPAEYLSRIFDPFFTTKGVGRGTGLGLTVAYGIVEKHGGKIEVESQVGRGTTFTVVLPHQA